MYIPVCTMYDVRVHEYDVQVAASPSPTMYSYLVQVRGTYSSSSTSRVESAGPRRALAGKGVYVCTSIIIVS